MDAQAHNETPQILQYFRSDHLPSDLQHVAVQCQKLAKGMEELLPVCAETTAGLRKLLEAKDCFVRARLDQR